MFEKYIHLVNVITENQMGLLEDVFISVEYTINPDIKSKYSEESDEVSICCIRIH